MKIQEIQTDLERLSKIKFNKKVETDKFKNYKQVIDQAVIQGNSTVMDHGKGYQCPPGRKRGIADLFRLCKYYFPETKLCDITKYMQNTKFAASFCGTTNQTVYRNANMPYSYRGQTKTPYIRLKNRNKVQISE